MSADAGVPPHSLEAELGMLGAILIRPDVLHDVREHADPEDCYRDAHRRIFRAMLQLAEAHVAIDPLTLGDSLTRTDEFEKVGGALYLFKLTDGVPHSTHAVDYARIVREKSRLRQIILAAQRTLADAYEASTPSADVLDAAQAALSTIADGHVAGGGLVPMKTIMPAVVDELQRLATNQQLVTGIGSGLTSLDEITRGFQKKALIVIGAQTSMGKTSFGLNIAEHAAVAGAHVAIFALEMDCLSLGIRFLASRARISHGRLMSGFVRAAEWGPLSEAMGCLGELGIYIDDSSSLTAFDVRARARRLRADGGLDLIIVDYLQLMRGAQRAENKNLEVADISRSLKMIAKDLDVPVLLLSQLSRAPAQRTDRRPQLSDLRDSGAIEQDADVVLLLYRDASEKGVAEISVAKHRNGPTGFVKVAFVEELMRFENLESA